MIDKTKPYGKYANMKMPCGFLYLDNSGSKWVTQDMRFVLVLEDGTREIHLADYWEALGNFARISYRYKHRRWNAFPVSCDMVPLNIHVVPLEYWQISFHSGTEKLPHVIHKK